MKTNNFLFEVAPNYPNIKGLSGTIIIRPAKDVEVESFVGRLLDYSIGPFPQILETLSSFEFLENKKLSAGQEYRFPISYDAEISEQYSGNFLKYGTRLDLTLSFKTGEFGVSQFLGKEPKKIFNQNQLKKRINIPYQRKYYSIADQKKEIELQPRGNWIEIAIPILLLGIINVYDRRFLFETEPQLSIFLTVGLIVLAGLIIGGYLFLKQHIKRKTGKITSLVQQQNERFFHFSLGFENSFLIRQMHSSFSVMEEVSDTRSEEKDILTSVIYQAPTQKYRMPVGAVSTTFELPEDLPGSVNIYSGSIIWRIHGKIKFFGFLSAKYASSFIVKRQG